MKVSLWKRTAEVNQYHGLAGEMMVVDIGGVRYGIAQVLKEEGEE